MSNVTVRTEVMVFARAMEMKLRVNDYDKGGWHNSATGYLLRRCREELNELEDSYKNYSPASLKKEAVDVANFAMMIFDNVSGVQNGYKP